MYAYPVHARRKNVISFGDSAHEREALIRATEGTAGCSALTQLAASDSKNLPAMAAVWQLVPESELELGHTVQCLSCRRTLLVARDQAEFVAAGGVPVAGPLDLQTAG